MKKIGTLVLSALFFTSCCCNKQQCTTSTGKSEDSNQYALIGKKGITTFPQMKVETNYISDSTMHWKTTNLKGVVAEGDEKINYEKITDHLHFLNWIEENGYVISLIINTKEGKVKAYWSYDDRTARGNRSATFTDGTFEFVK